jgi:hypothetical protein
MTATAAPSSRSWKIDFNVPLPDGYEAQRGKAKPPAYPLYDMGVGRSFYVRWSEALPRPVVINRVSTAVNRCQRATDREFTTRTDAKGIRVWRTA